MHELVFAMSDWLLHYLARSAIALTIIALAACLGHFVLRKVGPLSQHRLWLSALFTGVVFPLLPQTAIAHLGVVDRSNAGVGTVTILSHLVGVSRRSWELSPLLCDLLVALYLVAVTSSATRLFWRWRRTQAMTDNSTAAFINEATRATLHDAARWFAIPSVQIRCSRETRGPVVLGLQRQLLLVPEAFFTDETDEDIAAALAHECAHLARRDFAKNLVYECVAALAAYHPACWLIRRRIAETREVVCDEMAARVVGDRPQYAASLLRLATAMADRTAAPLHAIGVFDANILEERIMHLTTESPKLTIGKRVALNALAVCTLLGSAVSTAAMSFDLSPQVNHGTYHVGNGVSAPLLVFSTDATYTEKARRAKYQGVSVVSLIVDANGMPQHIRTTRKLGMGLDEKAIEAVQQYRFKPAIFQGKPVPVEITIEVNFHIY